MSSKHLPEGNKDSRRSHSPKNGNLGGSSVNSQRLPGPKIFSVHRPVHPLPLVIVLINSSESMSPDSQHKSEESQKASSAIAREVTWALRILKRCLGEFHASVDLFAENRQRLFGIAEFDDYEVMSASTFSEACGGQGDLFEALLSDAKEVGDLNRVRKERGERLYRPLFVVISNGARNRDAVSSGEAREALSLLQEYNPELFFGGILYEKTAQDRDEPTRAKKLQEDREKAKAEIFRLAEAIGVQEQRKWLI